MWKHHAKLERNSLVLLIGIVIVVAIGGLVEISPLFYLESTIEKVQGTLQQLITAAQANDTAQAEQLSNQIDQETTAANQVWDAYGITACGSGSTGQNQQQQDHQQNQS